MTGSQLERELLKSIKAQWNITTIHEHKRAQIFF